MGEVLLHERGGGVVLARLSNPPHGLIDAPMGDDLEELVARAASDEALTGIVLTGDDAERLVAHYDVGELLAASRASPSVGAGAARASLTAVGALRRVPGAAEAFERTPLAGLSAAERFGEVFLRFNR